MSPKESALKVIAITATLFGSLGVARFAHAQGLYFGGSVRSGHSADTAGAWNANSVTNGPATHDAGVTITRRSAPFDDTRLPHSTG